MDKKSRYHFREVHLNCILLVLGVYITIESIRIGFGTLKEPEAGLFPFIGGVIILVSDIFILFGKRKSSEPLFQDRNGIKIFSALLCIFILWIIAMPSLGYVIVTFLASFVISKVLKLEGWLRSLVLAGGITLFIYLLFDYWLYIDLPRGILG